MSFNQRDYKLNTLMQNYYISKERNQVRNVNNNKIVFDLPFKINHFDTDCYSGFIDEDGYPSCLRNVRGIDDQNDTNTWLLPPGKHSNSECAFIKGRANECYKDPDTGEWGPNYYMTVILTYKNGETFNIFNKLITSMDPLPSPPYRYLHKFTFENLPKDELVYKASIFRAGEGYIITQKGNLYVFNNNYIGIEPNTKLYKTNISNVVEFQPKHYQWGGYSYAITEDGSLYYVLNNPRSNNFVKMEGLPRIVANNKVYEYDHSNNITVLGEDGKFYFISEDHVERIIELPEDVVMKDYSQLNRCLYVLSEDNKVYQYNFIAVTDNDTNELTYDLNELGVINTLDISDPIISSPIPYVDIPIDHYSCEYNSTKYTNLIYLYRFALHQNISNDGSRNVVNYVAN